MYEGATSKDGTAIVMVAFSASAIFMLVVERLINALLTLVSRLVWGSRSSPNGCIEEPMATIAGYMKSKLLPNAGYGEDVQSSVEAYLSILEETSDGGGQSGLEGYASGQLVGACMSFLSTVATSLATSIVEAMTSLTSYLIWAAVVTLIFSLLYMIQENSSSILIETVEQWNKSYGPLVHKIILIPLQIVDVMFSAVIPIYNVFTWISKCILNNVFADALMQNIPSVKKFGLALGRACKHTALELPQFANAVFKVCDYDSEGDLCYEPGNGRIFDFISIFKELRTMAAALSTMLVTVCSRGAALSNIALFPFMDINLAKGVHNIVNAAVYTVFHVPAITAQRCNRHGPLSGSPQGTGGASLLLCMPDLNQPINMMVAGVRNMGMLVDNWLDVSSIIIQRSLNLMTPQQAAALDCESTAKSLVPASYSKPLFDKEGAATSRHKVVVGLTSGLYAVTDGVHAQYFNHYDSVESIASPNVWPIEIDTKFGVAAVTYRSGSGSEDRDGMGESSTTMLGCRCLDNDGLPPIRIQCALALKSAGAMAAAAASYASGGADPSAANYSSFLKAPQTQFEVVFQQRSTADYLTCAMTQISVQSVRWPATRFTGSYRTPRFAAGTVDGSEGVVDATIWVSPLCTSRAGKFPEVCTPMFKAAACYPYCMAARMRGSGGGGTLVLYNAPDWHERVHLMKRDCIVDTPILKDPVAAIKANAALFLANGTASSTDARPNAEATSSGLADAVPGSSVASWTWVPDANGCIQSSTASTIVRKDVVPKYRSSVQRSRSARSILMMGQPFAYAGDVTLTAVKSGDGEYWVAVDRLYGSESNEYTMVKVRTNFPANPPADTVKIGGDLYERVDRVPIPYSFSDMGGVQHPAVSTQSSVFFAVNPSLAMFKGFARGCASLGQEWSLQLSALSSYAPIKVWKIDPFAYCPSDASGTSETCGTGRVEHAEIPDAFTKIIPKGADPARPEGYSVFDINKCEVPFSVAVVGMEYVNEENIAVTVLKASFYDYSPETGLLRPDAKNASYQVYFLSTTTMGISTIPWERDVMVSAASAAEGQLCPAMRRLPNVGSLVAEVTVAGVEIIRKIVDIIVLLPAIVQMWDKQENCPIVTHGHTLLRKCGADLLSMEHFFDALNRANAHFWRSFSIVAERARDLGADQIANIIDGVAYYGESSVSPTSEYGSIVRTVRIPSKELGSQMMQGIVPLSQSAISNELAISANPMRMFQFSYNLVASVISGIIPLSIRLSKNPKDMDAAREMLAMFNNKLYQAREVYYASITLGMVQGCNGLALMLGYSNPWATLLRKQCEASPVAIQGVYDLALSLLVDVPFAKCICVDAAAKGANFQRYAMDNCYYFAPTHLKPTMLGLIENAASGSSVSVRQSCMAMVQFAKDGLADSMQPWFDAQFRSTEALGSSLDYLLSFVDKDAGRCMDFASNPYTTVLIPEPMDYFAACGATSMCAAKCRAEFKAFDQQLALEAAIHASNGVIKTVEKTVESMLFLDLDEDAYTPMNIMAMVELSDCR